MSDKPDLSQGVASDDLGEGTMMGGVFDGQPVLLVRHEGKACAFAGKCTHLGAPLADGLLVDGEVRCPWHHARFALSTGEAVAAPAFEPLAQYEVVEQDGRVRVVGERTVEAAAAGDGRGGRRVVIVGAGGAGHACAELLAREGQGANVTLIGADPDAPYDRTLCSKAYLAGKKERDDCFLRPVGGDDGATVRLDCAVTAIDATAKEIVTAAGDRIAYDVLVLATGSEPVAPRFDGMDRPGVHTLRTLADADTLIAAADAAKRVVVVGASFIALEVAAAMIARDLDVTVVAPDEVPLAPVMGRQVGAFVRDLHERKGVAFRLGRKVDAFDGACVTLDDGDRIAADLVVVGIGVEPCVSLARDGGLALADEDAGGGVAVDGRLRTSDPAIHAIGDIAAYPDPRLGRSIRVEHWAHAQHQGQYVARLLLGRTDADYGATPFFWSGHYDKQLRYVGHVAKPDDCRIEGAIDEADFAVFYAEDGTDRALLTCGRDVRALEVEADWDRA